MLFELLYKHCVEFQATLFDSSMGEVRQTGECSAFILMNAPQLAAWVRRHHITVMMSLFAGAYSDIMAMFLGT